MAMTMGIIGICTATYGIVICVKGIKKLNK